MGIIKDIKERTDDRIEEASELAWKWRCKITGKDGDSLKGGDFDDISDDDPKAAAAAAAAKGKEPGFGSEAAVKTMYEGKNSRGNGSYEWVDYPPKQISKSAARAQDRPAIKAFKIKDRSKPNIGGRLPLMYHKIEVQNPLLVAAIEPVLKERENVLLDINETASFEYPFRTLWFCQDEIVSLYKRTDGNDPVRQYLGLLCKLMDDLFVEMKVKRRHLQASGLVDFYTAWQLFPRGRPVYTYGMNGEMLAKVETTYYTTIQNKEYLIIKGMMMSFNGTEYIWEDKLLPINAYNGNMPVCELSHYPLDFHPEPEVVRKRLIARGKKMLEYQGLTYCQYTGIALRESKESCGPEKHNVEGRVLIDVVGYNKYQLHQGSRENSDPGTQRNAARRRLPPPPPPPDDDDGAAAVIKTNRPRRLTEEEQKANKEDMLSREDDLGFMSDTIGGYALKNKLWVKFYVEDIEPMVWNDKAYDHLVYNSDQKDLVLSFVENHNTNHSNSSKAGGGMDDVILGKGQGLIILLSGPPGTGKTLTAEAVADRTHRPLFYLQAEDLGINAAVLGANIKRAFDMATDWDAVILLDEADVFMAERNPNDIHRNELVSIFLRELEYFRGIIFLTTNLYHTIDTAFRSRVSLHLLFRSLDKEARHSVWQKFIDRVPRHNALPTPPPTESGGSESGHEEREDPDSKPVDEDDIRQLALWQLNGREIKNAVKMVESWCRQKGYVLTLGRLENGIKVTSPHASKDGDVDASLYE